MEIEYNGYIFIAEKKKDYINVIISKGDEIYGEHNFFEDITPEQAIENCKSCVV